MSTRRYYVYSIEAGFPPSRPLARSNNRTRCVTLCKLFSIKNRVSVYVVDNKPATMYQEIYMHASPYFLQEYDDMLKRRDRLS